MTMTELSDRVRRSALIAAFCVGLSVLTAFSSSAADTVAVVWDPSAGTNLIAGYKVYYGGASRTYTNAVSASTATTVAISNLVGGATYYFAATAIDTFGLESDFSVEALAFIPILPPPGSPTCTYALVLSPTQFGPNAATGTFSVSTASSCAWSLAGPSWVLLSATNGTGSAAGTFSVDPNAGSARLGLVTLSGDATNVSCTITQQAVPAGAVALATPLDATVSPSPRPQFTWTQSAPAATWFRLYVNRNGSKYLDQWLEGATSWTPPTDLAAGSYAWWVQTYNADGSGPWSEGFSFTIPLNLPGAVVLVSPSGSSELAATQRYTWKADTNALWYELYATRDGTVFADKWFTLSNSVVDSATGNFAVDMGGHAGGSYTWLVRGWSANGLGPWSAPLAFTLGIAGPVTLLTPTNTAVPQERQPQFSWTQSFPPAEWFRLCVTRKGIACVDQWLEGATNHTPAVALPGGDYSWAVQTYTSAGLGAWSTNAAFTIPFAVPTNVVLILPTVAATADSRQRYTWSADPAAVWYELYVTRNGGVFADRWFTLSNSVASGATNFAVDIHGHLAGSYQWYVRAWSPDGVGPWSGPGGFTMSSPPLPGAVTLLAPTNGATLPGRQPQLNWTQSTPSADWFRLYLARDGSPYVDQWLEGTTNWTAPAGLPAGTYSWAVDTYNSAGVGPWSAICTFTIPLAVPTNTVLLSPTGSVMANSTQRYTWEADPAALWYELYVTRNGAAFADQWFNLSNSVVDSVTGNFAVDVGGHSAGGYQWWVRGWSPDGLGPWSGSLSFQQ
jgi:hypothetical protein